MLNIESENGTPLDNQIEKADQQDESADDGTESFDYTQVRAVARIALYDDLRSAPRVTEIHPAPTAEFIESLASKIYEQAKSAGGTIPYTVIREVSENFIHARFAEATVSSSTTATPFASPTKARASRSRTRRRFPDSRPPSSR